MCNNLCYDWVCLVRHFDNNVHAHDVLPWRRYVVGASAAARSCEHERLGTEKTQNFCLGSES